jgi:hypothetical protein
VYTLEDGRRVFHEDDLAQFFGCTPDELRALVAQILGDK